MNPVPNDSLKVNLSKCGYYMEFSKAYPSFIYTAHHRIDKEDDNRTYREESSEIVSHANTNRLIHQNMAIDGNFIWTGPMIACLPINVLTSLGK